MSEKPTPLATYLAESGLTQADFAEILTRARGGAPVEQSYISKLARGVTKPTPLTKTMIAKATRGKIPVEAWEC